MPKIEQATLFPLQEREANKKAGRNYRSKYHLVKRMFAQLSKAREGTWSVTTLNSTWSGVVPGTRRVMEESQRWTNGPCITAPYKLNLFKYQRFTFSQSSPRHLWPGDFGCKEDLLCETRGRHQDSKGERADAKIMNSSSVDDRHLTKMGLEPALESSLDRRDIFASHLLNFQASPGIGASKWNICTAWSPFLTFVVNTVHVYSTLSRLYLELLILKPVWFCLICEHRKNSECCQSVCPKFLNCKVHQKLQAVFISSVKSSSVYHGILHTRSSNPLFQIFQILQILKWKWKDPTYAKCPKDQTCAIFLKSMGFKYIEYDIPVYQM